MTPTPEKEAEADARLTIQEALALAEMFGKSVVDAIMTTPLDEVVDRLRDVARASSRARTATVDRHGVVLSVE